MSTWAQIRAPLVVMLDDITGIEKVFEFPPSTMEEGDAPAYIVNPPGMTITRHTSRKQILYAVRIRLAVHDERYEDAAEQVEDFATLLQLKIDGSMKLGLTDAAITAQIFDEGGSFPIGDHNYAGQDCILTINSNLGVNFATG